MVYREIAPKLGGGQFHHNPYLSIGVIAVEKRTAGGIGFEIYRLLV